MPLVQGLEWSPQTFTVVMQFSSIPWQIKAIYGAWHAPPFLHLTRVNRCELSKALVVAHCTRAHCKAGLVVAS
jgi:hypothetical protein